MRMRESVRIYFMTTSEYIANRIKDRLIYLQWKKKDLAISLGVSPPVITSWLSGRHNFSIETLDKIAFVLRIDFFNRKNNKLCFPPNNIIHPVKTNY